VSKGKRHIGRGFNQFRKHLEQNSGSARYIASCASCRFYDEEDGCTNNNVTSFDLVKDEETGRQYCAYWKGYEPKGKRRKKREDDW